MLSDRLILRQAILDGHLARMELYQSFLQNSCEIRVICPFRSERLKRFSDIFQIRRERLFDHRLKGRASHWSARSRTGWLRLRRGTSAIRRTGLRLNGVPGHVDVTHAMHNNCAVLPIECQMVAPPTRQCGPRRIESWLYSQSQQHYLLSCYALTKIMFDFSNGSLAALRELKFRSAHSHGNEANEYLVLLGGEGTDGWEARRRSSIGSMCVEKFLHQCRITPGEGCFPQRKFLRLALCGS